MDPFGSAALLAIVTTGLVPVVHGMFRHLMDCRAKPGNDVDGGIIVSTSVPLDLNP